jgi:oligopeptidase B
MTRFFLPLFGFLLLSSGPMQAQNAPNCEQQPVELTIHGDTRIDQYYWLNDYWLDGPQKEKVVEYLHAENAYQEIVMSGTADLQELLYQEMLGRIKQTDESVPYFINGYWYITKTEEGKEYPIYIRKRGSMDAADEVMLDVNQMAEGFEYYSVSGLKVSPDNQWLAYGVDTVSRRQYTIYFKNLISGEILEESIANTSANVEWANDSKTIFYSIKDPLTLRNDKILKYQVGAGASPQLIFEEKDETFITYVGKTKSKSFLLIGSYSTVSSEVQFLSADMPDGTFSVLHPRERDHLYSIDHYGDKFYILSNWEALNFRLMMAPAGESTDKTQWKEVIAHRPDVLIEGMELFRDFLVLDERSNALSQIRVMPWEGAGEHYIRFDEEAYMCGTSYNPDFETSLLRYSYESMTTPPSQLEYDMVNRTQTLLKQQEVLGGFHREQYVTERIWATAKDGSKIPISVLFHKNFVKDGNAPLLLYGYGSYGSSMDPYFSSTRLSLVDRGFAFAIAHIRGGEEMGRQWYEDGKMFKKMNTFTDFIDCAEYLLQEQYTSTQHLYAMGGSAGGLLMGAVVNLRPELWKGIVSQVPFVDVVTTMLDERIPLTTGEYDEWGNPNDANSYFYMKSYSPYDNIEAKDYPNMLITTGLHDSQVQYFEPAKYVAKLRALKTDQNILIMHCDMSTGHGGSSGRFKRLREVARDYAFLLMLEGINK